MENFLNETLKQPQKPAPNFVDGADKEEKKPKRLYNYPKVGVVDVPKITQNPVGDLLELKQQENPKTAYKLTSKRNGHKLSNIASISACILGIGAGLFEIIKIKKM